MSELGKFRYHTGGPELAPGFELGLGNMRYNSEGPVSFLLGSGHG